MSQAFILTTRFRLPQDPDPTPAERYDPVRQLWIDVASGKPVVALRRSEVESSRFGETQSTATKEGIDASEVSGIYASKFGETTLTETREGMDQPELPMRIQSSRFGETTVTKTQEGNDQSEGH